MELEQNYQSLIKILLPQRYRKYLALSMVSISIAPGSLEGTALTTTADIKFLNVELLTGSNTLFISLLILLFALLIQKDRGFGPYDVLASYSADWQSVVLNPIR